MLTLSEIAAKTLADNEEFKNQMVHKLYKEEGKLNANECEILTFVQFWRRGEAVAMGALPANRNVMLELAVNGTYLFSADVTVVCFEGYMATAKKNPLTGEPWENGDMAYIAQHERGRERGLVKEAVLVHAVDRSGHLVCIGRAFEIKDKEVVWEEDLILDHDSEKSEEQTEGLIPEALRFAMTRTTMEEIVNEGAAPPGDSETEEDREARINIFQVLTANLPPEVREYHQDAAALKSIAQSLDVDGPMMLGLSAEPNSERARLIDEGMHKAWDGIPGVSVKTSADLARDAGGS